MPASLHSAGHFASSDFTASQGFHRTSRQADGCHAIAPIPPCGCVWYQGNGYGYRICWGLYLSPHAGRGKERAVQMRLPWPPPVRSA